MTSRMSHGSEPDSLDLAQKDLHSCLDSRGRYTYSYAEFWLTRIESILCCCCKKQNWLKKRVKRMQRHKMAEEMLAKETDFF